MPDLVGPFGKEPVVGHQKKGEPSFPGQIKQQILHHLGIPLIQTSRRLIGKDNGRSTGKGTGDGHPLPLATGELVGVVA